MYTTIMKLFGSKVIAGKWREIVIGGLLLVVAYQNISDTRWVLWADTIPHLKEQLSLKSYELELIEDANKTLTESIADRNQEIARFSEVSQQLRENTAVLQEEIANINSTASTNVRIVERQVIPQECTGAMNFLFDSIPELNYSDELLLDEDQ